MIKVGSIVQSNYVVGDKEGNLGVVLRHQVVIGPELIQVFYPKTRTSGWAQSKDMKVVA